MAVSTREGLKNYCLRALGAPALTINVTEEQLQDRLDEAIDYFKLYHYDGIERMYLRYCVQETDFPVYEPAGSYSGFSGVSGAYPQDHIYIDIPDHIYGVKRIVPFRQGLSSANLFDIQYQLRLNDLYELTNTSVAYYAMTMQHMTLLDQILNGYPQFEFNRLSGKLRLEVTKTKLAVGTWIVIECYAALDPEANTRVYNDPWLKRYVEALFKRQWGANLKKFSGLALPGGVTIDGKDLYLESLQEIKELEDEMTNKSSPLGFIMG
jgi:hypothetical protein